MQNRPRSSWLPLPVAFLLVAPAASAVTCRRRRGGRSFQGRRAGSMILLVGASLALIVSLGVAGRALAQERFPTDEQVREAQLLALELDGGLLPDENRVQALLFDLQAIRCAFPEIAFIRFRPEAVPDELIVGLTEEAFERLENGAFTELDDLNAELGAITIRILGAAILIEFDRVYNIRLLARLYEPLPGVRFAQPNFFIGDGSTVSAEPPIYTFRLRFGDCPSGCLFEEAFSFEVDGAEVTAIGPPPEPTGAEPDATCENFRGGPIIDIKPIDGSGLLASKEKLKVKRCGSDKVLGAVAFDLFSDGTWDAVTDDPFFYSGTYTDSGKGKLSLTFDSASLLTLFAVMESRAATLCGQAVTGLSASQLAFKGKVKKGKAKLKLKFAFTGVAADGQTGTAKLKAKYKGSFAPTGP